MINFCAQIEIQGSKERVWNWLTEELPPEYRHPGMIDMRELEAKSAPENAAPSANFLPVQLSVIEILSWKEGFSFGVRLRYHPYVQGVVAHVWLKELSGDKTIANLWLELRLGFGCLLMVPAQIGYWLFRGRINRMILQSLVEMRYEFETGNKLDPQQPITLPLDRLQITRCR